MSARTLALASAALLASTLTSQSLAQTTYVVDVMAGPGSDFTTIQPALNVAGPFDVIEVRAGSYPPFVAEEAARIIATGHVVLDGTPIIRDIDSGDWMVLAGLHLRSMIIQDCEGTVLVEDLRLRGNSGTLWIDECDDVRLRGVDRSNPNSFAALEVMGSRVQLSDSHLGGDRKADDEVEGRTAIQLGGGSFLHAIDCIFQGQEGGDSDEIGVVPPDGGDAIHANEASRTRLVRSTLTPGIGGTNDSYPWVPLYGANGWRLDAQGGHHEFWETESLYVTLHTGATLDDATPLPSLTQGAAPLGAGSTAQLTVQAAPFSSGRLLFGRRPMVVSQPNTALERLIDIGRAASLGAMNPGGEQTLSFPIPSAWPRGTVVFLQTSATDVGGVTDMSNSIALIVR